MQINYEFSERTQKNFKFDHGINLLEIPNSFEELEAALQYIAVKLYDWGDGSYKFEFEDESCLIVELTDKDTDEIYFMTYIDQKKGDFNKSLFLFIVQQWGTLLQKDLTFV